MANIHHFLVHKNPYAYSSWPSVAILKNGDWVIGFCQSMRHDYLVHREPTFHNLLVRSKDQGKSWDSHPQTVPSYDFFGIDCIGVSCISNGDVLVRTVKDPFIPLAHAERDPAYAHFRRTYGFDGKDNEGSDALPWAWDFGTNYVFRSTDHGYTWEEPIAIDLSPFKSGFSPRAIVELSNGDLLLPLSDETLEPVPDYVLRSQDGGKTWGNLAMMAKDERVGFYEPALIALANGKVIAMLRTHEPGDYHLYQCTSYDNGYNWSAPQKTPMWGLPADMLRLQDGRILCVYGYRKYPYGIRACLSSDEGETWDIEDELIIRDDFPNRNLGYPTSVQMEDGTIFTTYYGEDTDGVTCIHGSFYTV